MRQPHSLKLFAILLMFTSSVHAEERDSYRDIRWLGRGNTGVSAVSDASSIFYNPAGLGLNTGFSFSLANPQGGTNRNVYNSINELRDLNSDTDSLTQKFKPFLGKQLGMEAAVFPNVQGPYFAAGLFNSGYGAATFRNPVNPELIMRTRNDWGFAGGFGIPVARLFAFGFALKYTRRTDVRADVSGDTLLDASANVMKDIVRRGQGWGVNTGIMARLPVAAGSNLGLGLAVEDLGYTKFTNGKDPAYRPARQSMMVNSGVSFEYDSALFASKILWDMRQLNDKDLHYTKKIFLGAEVSVLRTDIRAGFYQGYWTAGCSIRIIPLLNFHATTFGEELDSVAGIRENRVYLVGVSLGADMRFGNASGKRKQRYTLDKY